MRKNILVSLIIIGLLFALVAVAMAADKTQVDVYDQQKELVKSVVFVIGQGEYFVNGQIPGVKMDAKPFIEQGRTFVPVRYLGNALGVDNDHISWESPKATFKQPGFPVVELTVGNKQLKSNGQAKTMDTAPMLKTGRTYLPARWVAEALGYQVAWDAKNKVVMCWPQGVEKPDVSKIIEYIDGEQPQEEPTVPEPSAPSEEDIISFSGKLLNPDDYKVVSDRKIIPPEFKQPRASIMYVTVDELKQQPVKLGDGGYKIIYDVQVIKDKVYVTQAGSSLTPASLVLAKGNDVSAQRNNTIVKYNSNPFTHGYTVSLDADTTPIKIEDVTHIMLLYYDQVLAVENPLYNGVK